MLRCAASVTQYAAFLLNSRKICYRPSFSISFFPLMCSNMNRTRQKRDHFLTKRPLSTNNAENLLDRWECVKWMSLKRDIYHHVSIYYNLARNNIRILILGRVHERFYRYPYFLQSVGFTDIIDAVSYTHLDVYKRQV